MLADFAPCRVRVVLSDNGFEWSDQRAGRVRATPSGRHPVYRLFAAQGIARRFIKPFHPQTNGMAERFNRRVSAALAAKAKIAANSGRNCFANHALRNDYL